MDVIKNLVVQYLEKKTCGKLKFSLFGDVKSE